MICRPLLMFGFLAFMTSLCAAEDKSAPGQDWSIQQISKLPKSEKPIRLFNGKDLSGWKGQTKKYFSVRAGIIVAANGKDDAPGASTYLVTEKKYRNFRLIFESKLVTSEMHSGIALWGKNVTRKGDPFSYQGHLVMYPSNYGFYDLYRRNSIYRDKGGVAKKVGRQHQWNQMGDPGDRPSNSPRNQTESSSPIGLTPNRSFVNRAPSVCNFIPTASPRKSISADWSLPKIPMTVSSPGNRTDGRRCFVYIQLPRMRG